MTVEAAAAQLRAAGVAARVLATTGPESAGGLAATAVRAGADTVFACGGDGTMHDVLQGLMQDETTRQATLALLPLGTGNVLAADLKLPLSPAHAIATQLSWSPREIAIGHVTYQRDGQERQRYFLITVGVGSDAEMLYRVTARDKDRWGQFAYLWEAIRVFLRYGNPLFAAQLTLANGKTQRMEVSQASAVRITDFGGFMRRFAPLAALTRDDFQCILFRTQRSWDYVHYLTRVLFDRHAVVAGVETPHALALACELLPGGEGGQRISVEADGEYLGTVPAKVRLVQPGVRLLMPRAEPPENRANMPVS